MRSEYINDQSSEARKYWTGVGFGAEPTGPSSCILSLGAAEDPLIDSDPITSISLSY